MNNGSSVLPSVFVATGMCLLSRYRAAIRGGGVTQQGDLIRLVLFVRTDKIDENSLGMRIQIGPKISTAVLPHFFKNHDYKSTK
jgi:hypothetical protein